MERITSHQFMTLGSAVLLGLTFLPVASTVIQVGGRDAWMSILPGFAIGIPYGFMLLTILTQYPGKNLLKISELLLGKWIGKLIGVIYIFISGYYGILILATIGDLYQASIMPLTPIWVLYLGVILLALYLACSGVEVLARFSEVVFPLIVVILVLNLILAIPRIEQGELLPILGNGLKPVLFGVIKVLPFIMQYFLFVAGVLAFLPTGKQEVKQFKAGIWRSVFLVGILDMFVVLFQILVFGPEESVRLVYGLLVLGKMVEVSRTIAGVESLFMGIYLGSAVIKICACLFMVTWGLETVFNLKGKKWKISAGIGFFLIAFKYTKAPLLFMEIMMMQGYIILPFVALWIPLLWGVRYWKRGAGA